MHPKRTVRGFTLAEIVVVSAILSIIALVSFSAFKNMHRASALRAGGDEVYQAFTDARAKTLGSEEGTVYGVFIASTSVTRFVGETYSAVSATNRVYSFEAGVTATGTGIVAGTSTRFERLTGEPNVARVVYLRNDDGTATSTITVHASGLIERQ